MNAVATFVSNMGWGTYVFYPLVLTLVVVVAWFAYDEVGGGYEAEEK